jgi:serine protease
MDQHAYYTNWGSGLDISAPGGELYSNTTAEAGILSAVPGNYTGSDKTTGPIAGAVYAYYQGTSMAAPQVTGVAAIVASKTGLRGAALRSRLESTADDLGAKGYDTSFGAGRVNAYRAVTQTTLNESGGGTTPPPPNQAPKANFTYSCGSSATCAFTDQSTDSDGTVTGWSWSFGDGKTSTVKNPSNTYSAAGTYTVTQTVTDNGGLTGTTSKTITCSVRGGRVRCS